MVSVKVKWEFGETSGRIIEAGGPALLLAHGAGAGHDHPLMTGLATALSSLGFTVMTFNYPYTEAGRRHPDRTEKLLACHRAVLDWLTVRSGGVVLAGRSMGGRMATYLAAEGAPCLALALFAYPLHPLGRPDSLRAAHLAGITRPMLFVVGTRDEMCRMDLFDELVRPLPTVTTHLLEGADHGWRVKGRPYPELAAEAAAAVRAFVDGFAGHGPERP